MGQESKQLLAFLLCGVILFGWISYRQKQLKQQQGGATATTVPVNPQPLGKASVPTELKRATVAGHSTAAATKNPVLASAALPIQKENLENPNVRLTIS